MLEKRWRGFQKPCLALTRLALRCNAMQEGTLLDPVQVFLKTSPRFLVLLYITPVYPQACNNFLVITCVRTSWPTKQTVELSSLLNIAFNNLLSFMLKSAFPDSQSSLNINMLFNMLMVLIRHMHIQIGLLGGFLELPRTASTAGLGFSVLASLCSENKSLIWFTGDRTVPIPTHQS